MYYLLYIFLLIFLIYISYIYLYFVNNKYKNNFTNKNLIYRDIYETTDIYKDLDNPNYIFKYDISINNNLNKTKVFKNDNISKWNIKMSSNNSFDNL
jgi:hypothetical protein